MWTKMQFLTFTMCASVLYSRLMVIGQKLREIRKGKNLTQIDIAKATGLVQPYVSRIENGHTIPGVETLEKWARALNVPVYQLLYDEEGTPEPLNLASPKKNELWGDSRGECQPLRRLRQCLAKMDEAKRGLLLGLAERMAIRARRTARAVKRSA